MTSQLKKLLEALKLASPFVMGSHYENAKHCVEMSISAVRVLRKHGINARVLPVQVVYYHDESNSGGVCGATREEASALLGPNADLSIFDGMESSSHVIVEITTDVSKVYLDLTIGQLRPLGVDVQPMFWLERQDLPSVVTPEGWEFDYHFTPEPRASELVKQCEEYDGRGVLGDLEDLVKIAIKAKGDYEAYTARVKAMSGSQYSIVMAKLVRMWDVGKFPNK